MRINDDSLMIHIESHSFTMLKLKKNSCYNLDIRIKTSLGSKLRHIETVVSRRYYSLNNHLIHRIMLSAIRIKEPILKF